MTPLKVLLCLTFVTISTASAIGSYVANPIVYTAPGLVLPAPTDDGSYRISTGPDGKDGTYHPEHEPPTFPRVPGEDGNDGSYHPEIRTLGGDDGSYHPELALPVPGPDGNDGSYHPEVRGVDGEDGSYHEHATHYAGVAEGQYSEAYNPLRVVPVPVSPVYPYAGHQFGVYPYTAQQFGGYPYTAQHFGGYSSLVPGFPVGHPAFYGAPRFAW